MIPPFDTNGNLPPGIHLVDWDEFVLKFDSNSHRSRLIRGMREALDCLAFAGCKIAYVDGSFVTDKEVPGDYDLAWAIAGVDLKLLKATEPLFWIFDNDRAAQKARYFGEFFPASTREQKTGLTFLEFFQKDKNGHPKGIVGVDL